MIPFCQFAPTLAGDVLLVGDDRLRLFCSSPDDIPALFRGDSSCGLYAGRRALFAAGCADDVFRGRYVMGRAISDLVAVYRGAGAYRPGPCAAEDIDPGDVLFLADSPASGIVHVRIVGAPEGGQGAGGVEIAVVPHDCDGRVDVRTDTGHRRYVVGRGDYGILSVAWP